MSPNALYAEAMRRNNRPRPTMVQRCINFTLNLFFTTFRLPVTLINRISNFLPAGFLTSASRTVTAPRKSARQEVVASVELIKSKYPIFEGINFTQTSYSDALTKSKTQCRLLLCYSGCVKTREKG